MVLSTHAAPMTEIETELFFDVPMPIVSSRPRTLDPNRVLAEVFGYPEFRSGQQDIVQHLFHGSDALVLMATGGGKSLCFQVPALAREGMGIVISPLIPLMKDQVEALRKRGIRAGALTHLLGSIDQAEIEDAVRNGSLDILYVSPERLSSQAFFRLIERCRISLIAVDEAHVVSRWGHAFRESYLSIGAFLRQFPGIPRVALTATADPETRSDILDKLDMTGCRIFQSSFDRPNLSINVLQGGQISARVFEIVARHNGENGVIFCATRRSVEQMEAQLNSEGFNAVAYHAGMSKEARGLAQRRFMEERGVVAVATIAFGMGIDKADVRFVIHTHMPSTAEGYYQEIGRAGRDGLESSTYLITRPFDGMKAQRRLLEKIDVETNDEAREFLFSELNKLQDMMGFVESVQCRKKSLLHLFGEPYEGVCGKCDRCRFPISCEDCSDTARTLVKTIAATGQRFGVSYLVEILQGIRSVKVLANEHEHLSVFGALDGHSKRDVVSYLRQMRVLGLIRYGRNGVLKLDQAAWPFIRGKGQVRLAGVSAKEPSFGSNSLQQRRQVIKADLPERSKALLVDLVTWRAGLAPQVAGELSSDCLLKLVSGRPSDEETLVSVLGKTVVLDDTHRQELLKLMLTHKGPANKADPLDLVAF